MYPYSVTDVLHSSIPDWRHLTKDALVWIDDVTFVSEQGTFCAVHDDLYEDLDLAQPCDGDQTSTRRRDTRYAFRVQAALRHRLLLLLARYIRLTYQVAVVKPRQPSRRTRLLPRPLYLRPLAPAAPLAPPA